MNGDNERMSAWKAPPGWKRIREQVFTAYGRRCWRCGAPATQVGHLVARALGGSWELSNLRPECQPCNSSDGASLGNRMRPRRSLTGRQRAAVRAKQWRPRW
jgi:5-methylcytosine-specific restriction endonuclease McrA